MSIGWFNATPQKKVINGRTYHILETQADPVKIVWNDKTGKQLRSFPEVSKFLLGEGVTVTTLMNGGL